MGRPRKDTIPADKGKFRIMRDGVFYADSHRADWGDVVAIEHAIAAILIERGDAKPV